MLEQITNDTDAVDILAMLEQEEINLTGQLWLKKYLTILYPDKFMTMLNNEWIDKIFIPIGLARKTDWFENSKIFSEEAQKYNIDASIFYHVIHKCIIDSTEKTLVEDTIKTNDEHIKKYVDKLKKSRNIIFRGAPGTGKSYLAKQIAAYIISGKTDYNNLDAEQKKQVEFVQFHPSYDYSDFVEGLRPVDNGNGSIGFELKDGIFKDFVKRARENFEKSTSDSIVIKKIQTNDAIESFLDDATLSGTTFATKKGRPFIIDDFNDNYIKISIPDNLISNQVTLNRKKLQRLLESEENFDNVKKIQKALGKNGASQSASYFFVLYEKIRKLLGELTETTFVKEEEKPFVFIID